MIALVNFAEPTWLEIKSYCKSRIEMHERTLRTVGLPPDETEGVRYAIVELDALLKFPNPSSMSADVSKEPE